MSESTMTGGVLVVGAYSWGWGTTLAEAKERYKAHFGKLSDGYVVYELPDTMTLTGVDQMGYIHWTGEPKELPEPTIHKGRKTL